MDAQSAASGQLQLPIGVAYNATDGARTARFATWQHGAEGGIVHAQHSQTWSVHMFEIGDHDVGAGAFNFTRGGQQGGRNWCTCKQCYPSYVAAPPPPPPPPPSHRRFSLPYSSNSSPFFSRRYAGRGLMDWCGQHKASRLLSRRAQTPGSLPRISTLVPTQDPPDNNDTRLVSGLWFVENILDELDSPTEYYLDSADSRLYLWPNATEMGVAPLVMSRLETLVEMRGSQAEPVANVTVSNLRFRDSAPTYMSDWSPPSGGDWSLHRGGALFLEGVTNVTVSECVFHRLDGNALFLSRFARNVTVERSDFAWIGESAVASWGETAGYDATGGEQPRGTLLQHNVMRELGIFQKQSSGWGQAKTATSTVRGNIMFNLPRAAINFNDMMGGGNLVEGNLIFNTCRESGDHGPINSWDRMPFLTRLRDGSTPSFDPLPTTIERNFIFGNYGAGQGVARIFQLKRISVISHR